MVGQLKSEALNLLRSELSKALEELNSRTLMQPHTRVHLAHALSSPDPRRHGTRPYNFRGLSDSQDRENHSQRFILFHEPLQCPQCGVPFIPQYHWATVRNESQVHVAGLVE